MSNTIDTLDEKCMIPDLLKAAPRVRPVLDRHGLRGCGGPLGPVESLGFFAKAHDVPLVPLLAEIRAELNRPEEVAPPTAVDGGGTLADAIYRPFFKAGIVVALTAGAVWGAYLLLRIAFTQSFTAVDLHDVNAHGHAQIFGWVGLFVMGFAYQAFPRFKQTSLPHPHLAFVSFGLMLAGIVGRSVCEPLAHSFAGLGPVAIFGSNLEVLAIAIFAFVIARTLHASEKPLAVYDYYIASAIFWFVVQAIYETIYLAATLAATDHDALIHLVRTWQGALRDVQIHGFALLMILGVSQRIFPHFYGLPTGSRRLSLIALVCVNMAVAGEAIGLILMNEAGHAWATVWYVSALMLAGAVAALVWSWHIFSPSADADRSLKFLRAAYVWLFISLTMLVLLPAYQFGLLAATAPESDAAQIGFSHAYYGAIRHAITVGFVSLMIVGVAAKVVPTLSGVDVRALSSLWLPFCLINAGCGLRVTAQTLTDFSNVAFPVAGVSGLLEVSGLAIWGVHLWRIMAGRLRANEVPGACPRFARGDVIEAENHVGEILDAHPELLSVFLSFGFQPLKNPLLRKTVAKRVTLSVACRMMGVDVGQLIDALNKARTRPVTARKPLPVLILND
jgi:hypothetical protein